MVFDIITIFPGILKGFLDDGLLGKAIKRGLLEVNLRDLRDWTDDRHRTVDDKPFGGGLGMVMKVEPILKAVADLKRDGSRVILFGPGGRKFRHSSARRLSRYDHLIMICGRYEGVDERVSKHIADEEISIGDYVLMGGEVPAMVVTECVSRLIPGVIGKEDFLKERIDDASGAALEYPQFTRPASFRPADILSTEGIADLKLKGKRVSSDVEWDVPEVLVSGDHKEIAKWKREHGRTIR